MHFGLGEDPPPTGTIDAVTVAAANRAVETSGNVSMWDCGPRLGVELPVQNLTDYPLGQGLVEGCLVCGYCCGMVFRALRFYANSTLQFVHAILSKGEPSQPSKPWSRSMSPLARNVSQTSRPLSVSMSPKWWLFASQALTIGEPLQIGGYFPARTVIAKIFFLSRRKGQGDSLTLQSSPPWLRCHP